jgi:hypothetical protein
VAESWADEATRELTPVLTARMVRDRESVWIHAYPDAAMVVLTYPRVALPDHPQGEMPGLVRELHTARTARFGAAWKWETEVERHTAEGWQLAAHTVFDGDPWDAESTLDRPPTF